MELSAARFVSVREFFFNFGTLGKQVDRVSRLSLALFAVSNSPDCRARVIP
jgi:hypothetical protein